MRPAARLIAAGVVAAALGAAPGYADAQSTDPSGASPTGTTTTGTSGSSTTPSTQTPSSATSQPGTASQSSTSTAASGGVDENAAREHLSQARQALADLTKLPAAATLQGEQRTAVSNLIQAFNGLATATTDWRPKFKAVNDQLDQILGADASGSTGTAGAASTGATPSDSSASSTAGAAGATGATGASSGGYDPTILAKLREVKMHLDGFQEASGDPTPHFDAIDEIVDAALNGTAGASSSSVGTTGSSASTTGTAGDASAAGSVTISRAQLEEIKQHVAKLRAASEAAAARRQ